MVLIGYALHCLINKVANVFSCTVLYSDCSVLVERTVSSCTVRSTVVFVQPFKLDLTRLHELKLHRKCFGKCKNLIMGIIDGKWV